MLGTAGTTGAIAVPRDLNPDTEGTKVRNLTEKIHGCFRVAVFQLPVCGAHAAERANLTVRANRPASGGKGANLVKRALPAGLETATANVVAVPVRKNANGHASRRVDCASVLAATAGVALGRQRGLRESSLMFEQPEVLRHASGIAEFEGHGLLGSETNVKRTLRAVGARIDEGIKLKFNTQLLFREALHFVDFVPVHGSGNRLQLERQAALEKEADTSHATIEGAGNASEFLIGLAGGAVKSDFDCKRTIFGKMVRHARCDHRAVGEDRDEESVFLGQRVNLKKVLARENFASGEANPEAAGLHQFIKEARVFLKR